MHRVHSPLYCNLLGHDAADYLCITLMNPEVGIRYFLPFRYLLIHYFNVAIRYRYSATFQKFAIRYLLYAIRYTLFATSFEQCNRFLYK
jgi:hypothetical protein